MATKNFKNRIDLDEVQNAIDKIRNEVQKVIVGQQGMIDLIIAGLLADGHLLLEGVPGIAKTLTARLIARTIKIKFSRIQFTPDQMPSDIIGTSVFNAKTSEFEFKHGPIFANMVLIDEINRSPAKTQAALFEVMEEKQITADGTTYRMSPPFIVIATQNPVEYEGTYRLPEAQLDRFLFKINIDYPSLDDDIEILSQAHKRGNSNKIDEVKPVITAKDFLHCRSTVKMINIDDNIIKYIAEIVYSTRNHSSLFLGGSPRASLAIMDGAKAYALMNGRDFITPDDVKSVVFPAMRHRIQLTPEKEMEGKTPDNVIQEIIENVEVPR